MLLPTSRAERGIAIGTVLSRLGEVSSVAGRRTVVLRLAHAGRKHSFLGMAFARFARDAKRILLESQRVQTSAHNSSLPARRRHCATAKYQDGFNATEAAADEGERVERLHSFFR